MMKVAKFHIAATMVFLVATSTYAEAPPPVESGTIESSGARIFYEASGAGPLLLLVSGGSGDADGYEGFRAALSGSYTVVTYDRRGYARSPLGDPAAKPTMKAESEDIHLLLKALGRKPAYIFGSSIGAAIALDFAARYPDDAAVVVAHEPPANYLTRGNSANEGEQVQAVLQKLKTGDAVEALRELARIAGVQEGAAGRSGAPEGNLRFFLTREFPMLARYRYDADALRAATSRTRLIVAVGRDSAPDSMGALGARTLAPICGAVLVEFPGDHAAPSRTPEALAEALAHAIGTSGPR